MPAERVSSSHRLPPCPGLDLLENVADRFGIAAANTHSPFAMPLCARDQGRQNRCAASSFCTAMYLRALFQVVHPATLAALRSGELRPSPAHAYHRSRVAECETNRRCDCGPVCGGDCDDCGSLPQFIRAACRGGIVTERAWPAELAARQAAAASRGSARASQVRAHNARVASLQKRSRDADAFLREEPYYRLSVTESPRISMAAEVLIRRLEEHLRDAEPVVAFLLQFPNQLRFFQRQGLLSTATRGATVYAPCHIMPSAEGSPGAMTHAVTVVGCNPALRLLRVRNSRGTHWGFHGDFALRYEDVTRSQITRLVAVLEVSLHNIKKI